MTPRRRWLRFMLACVGALLVVWIAYNAAAMRRTSTRLPPETGCESDPNTVADMSQFSPASAPIRCEPWDVGTGVAGYVWRAPNPRAVVLVEHGWGDYAQRYVKQFSQLVPHLLTRGMSVYAIDMWGNGRSPGPRGATDIGDAVEDHLAARRKLREQPLPVFLLGHSVGGLVTATSALRDDSGVRGMVLIAPALKWEVSGAMRFVARVGGFLAPTLRVPMPPPDPAAQSRDTQLHARLASDPLMNLGNVSWVTAATGASIAHENWEQYRRLTIPLLVVSGTADPVTNPDGIREFMDAVGSDDKTLGLVDGGRHSLLDDPPSSREAVQIILRWLDGRLDPNQPARGDAIDDYVSAQMQQLRLPGLALAVVRGGTVVTLRTYGRANFELDAPVTRDTVFELGSLTKQFTAVAIMLLVEDGALRLDDSIATHLPEVPESWRAITVRHLLTHSSGLQEYLSVPGLPDQAHALGHREMTRLFASRTAQEFPPGDTWAYSNTGYLLLGDIIERASGQSYWEFLRTRILAPAGMHATGSSEPRTGIRNRAAGYGWSNGAFENRPPLSENAYAAGAIASTIADMTRWAAALHAGRLMSKASREQVWTPLTVTRGPVPPFSYGFGWVVDREHGRRAVLHSGGTPGFSSAIRHYPDAGLTVIVLANHGDRIIDQLPLEIAGMVLPEVARRENVDPDPPLTQQLAAALRGVTTGRANSRAFTPAMRVFLSTATARGLGEWIASHGTLTSLTYVQTEPVSTDRVLRYRASLGDARLWFSFRLTADKKIAQIYWW